MDMENTTTVKSVIIVNCKRSTPFRKCISKFVWSHRDEPLDLLYSKQESQESIYHCCHVDEVICDVPWIIDQQFLAKYINLKLWHRRTCWGFDNEKAFEGYTLIRVNFIEHLEASGRYLRSQCISISDSKTQRLEYDFDMARLQHLVTIELQSRG